MCYEYISGFLHTNYLSLIRRILSIMFTPGPILGEFFGTLVLVVFGDGNIANLVLKDTKANGSNWVHIC